MLCPQTFALKPSTRCVYTQTQHPAPRHSKAMPRAVAKSKLGRASKPTFARLPEATPVDPPGSITHLPGPKTAGPCPTPAKEVAKEHALEFHCRELRGLMADNSQLPKALRNLDPAIILSLLRNCQLAKNVPEPERKKETLCCAYLREEEREQARLSG